METVIYYIPKMENPQARDDYSPSVFEKGTPQAEGWLTYEEWDTQYPLPVPLAPTLEELQTIFTAAIQDHLDSFARTRNYDGIMSAASYATSTVPKFRTEGQYAVEARDATWAKGYEILDAVLSGQRPMPTIEKVIAELPPLAWPEV